MFHVKSEKPWRLIPDDLPVRQPPRRSPGLQNLGGCQVDIPLIKSELVIAMIYLDYAMYVTAVL